MQRSEDSRRSRAELVKKFDLNIEKVLEDWGTAHAIRELISNALDEQILTGTAIRSTFAASRSQHALRGEGCIS